MMIFILTLFKKNNIVDTSASLTYDTHLQIYETSQYNLSMYNIFRKLCYDYIKRN